jgi:transcription elongation factor GreB
MSRGFVKEDDQEEAPFIPPRAALPEGTTNYVTPRGLSLLHAERSALEEERTADIGSDHDRRHAQGELDGRLALVNERIVTARVEEPGAGPVRSVRFGATATFQLLVGRLAGTLFTFTIVGVDEANVKEGLIAITSSIARALIGKRKGGAAEVALGSEVMRLKVISID